MKAPITQLSLPLADPRVERSLHHLEQAKSLLHTVLEGTAPSGVQLQLVREVGPAPLPLEAMPPYVPPDDHRLVVRRGRVRKDGTRVGARVLRRMTVYLDPEVAAELEAYCAHGDDDMSEVINRAVVEWLERR